MTRRVIPPSVIVLRVVRGPATGTQVAVTGTVEIGRGDVDLDLADTAASHRHVRVTPSGPGLLVTDLGSRAGTTVNDQRIATPSPALPGDLIGVGASTIAVLELRREGPPRRTEVAEWSLIAPTGEAHLLPHDGEVLVGRDRERCQLVLDDPGVSRVHARLARADGAWTVEDLASSNGTELNGLGLIRPHQVRAGDRVRFGTSTAIWAMASGADAGSAAIRMTIRRETERRTWSVAVEASPSATVGDVVVRLCAYLGLPAAPPAGWWWLYRERGGALFHPADAWSTAPLRPGDTLVVAIGPEALQETVLPPAIGTPAEPATVLRTPLPRTQPPPATRELTLPPAPESASLRGRGLGWRLGGGAVTIAVGLVIALVRPSYALFAMAAGVAGLVTMFFGVAAEQSRRRQALRTYHGRIAELRREAVGALRADREALDAQSPPLETLAAWVRDGHDRLWERQPADADFLRLRLGRGTVPAPTRVRAEPVGSGVSPAPEALALAAMTAELADVPICGPGPASPVVALVGDRRRTDDLGALLLVEAAVLHAPEHLSVAVLATEDSWAWARWLPHAEDGGGGALVAWDDASAADLASRLADRWGPRADAVRRGNPGHVTLLLVSGAALAVPEVAALLRRDLSGAAHIVLVAEHRRSLPVAADVVVELDAAAARVLGGYQGGPLGGFRSEGTDMGTAEALARALAHYADPARPSAGRRRQRGLLDLLGAPAADRLDVERLWRDGPVEALSAPVGIADDGGTMTIGFRRDGPHGMLAGTTGAGKSELLQSLLVALAATHPPERLTLFLIDFKGGAAFTELARLPHTVGVVTDLEQDGTLADRAFVSLTAEIDRRKHLLDEARVVDLVAYEQLPEAADAPLPSLLVVIDEFAVLVRQQPEVKERLDLVAAQGRSLGVHLLLAAQSPSGAVTPAVRANTNLWLALRVVSAGESQEMLGRPDAAGIAVDAPGRGYLRRGAGAEITGFQTSRIARPVAPAGAAVEVEVRPFADARPAGAAPAAPKGPRARVVTELEVVARRLVSEASRLGYEPQRPLWLPPLSGVLRAAEVPPPDLDPARLVACLGLTDEPARQLQSPHLVDLSASGSVLVVGTLGTGKTTALHQVVVDLAERHGPAALHVYAIEAGAGSLAPLEALPHTAAVVAAADLERLQRVFARLGRLVAERREQMAAAGVGDFLRWRSSRTEPAPWRVLVIDDYPAFKETAEAFQYGALHEQFVSLLQTGPGVGVHVVVATRQPGDVRANVANLFGARVLLRQNDAADYGLLGLRIRPERMPADRPGRALVAGGVTVQVVLPEPERIAAIVASALRIGAPDPITRLPARVPLLEVLARRAPSAGLVLLGLGGAETEPVAVDVVAEPVLAVLGDGRTGRSTTLLTVLASTLAADPATRVTLVAPRPSPLRALSGREGTTLATTPEELAALDLGGGLLLVDDAEALGSAGTEALERALRDARTSGLTAWIAARGADITRVYEGWARYLVSLRTGLLLQPGSDAGVIFDVRLPPRTTAMPAGRGYLVVRNHFTLVQVAEPPAPGDD